ncbi:MAG: DinB family protein [Terriglobales bacterium]
MTPNTSLHTLLAYVEEETGKWKAWFAAHPHALEARLDIAHADDVRGLLNHIFAVEMRYGQRLLGEPVTPFEQFQARSLSDIFQVGESGRAKLRQFLQHATDADLSRILTVRTLSVGDYSTSVAKVIVHALMHGIRHWAQLATALRQQGFKTNWPHDFMFTSAMQ